MSEDIKSAVIRSLTSSKNERICFEVIWDMTIGCGKGNRIILSDAFVKAGSTDRKRRNEAINRLMNKGLIFRAVCDAHHHGIVCYRYSVIKKGCRHFLDGFCPVNF